MECDPASGPTNTHPGTEITAAASTTTDPSPRDSKHSPANLNETEVQRPPLLSRDSIHVEKEKKRIKQSRVHKREKELCGLVTPVFLPLLEAGVASPTKPKKDKEKREKRHREEKDEGPVSHSGFGSTLERIPSNEGDARATDKGKENRRSGSKNRSPEAERNRNMELSPGSMTPADAVSRENGTPTKKDPARKSSKRSAIKKSSLKAGSTPRRRKRVSLVIDDQIVLPADNIPEPALTSPSETTASSASNSTTSLDDAIDPRLLEGHNHEDPQHHSLPPPTSLPSTSPDNHAGHSLSESPAGVETGIAVLGKENPPEVAQRTYFNIEPSSTISIPQHASAAPIYANTGELYDEAETADLELEDALLSPDTSPQHPYTITNTNPTSTATATPTTTTTPSPFHTYVGGLSGSGVSDVNQSGSYGYPSSLGASYLESYMKSRPLSVRLQAAEKGELEAEEKRKLIHEGEDHDEADFAEMDARVRERSKGRGRERDRRRAIEEEEEEEDMDVIGSMEEV